MAVSTRGQHLGQFNPTLAAGHVPIFALYNINLIPIKLSSNVITPISQMGKPRHGVESFYQSHNQSDASVSTLKPHRALEFPFFPSS